LDKTRHVIEYDSVENLVTILREYLPPNITVGIHCSLEDLYHIQVSLKNSFTNKFLFTRFFLKDVENAEGRAIITPVYKKKLMKYAFQETFVFRKDTSP